MSKRSRNYEQASVCFISFKATLGRRQSQGIINFGISEWKNMLANTAPFEKIFQEISLNMSILL